MKAQDFGWCAMTTMVCTDGVPRWCVPGPSKERRQHSILQLYSLNQYLTDNSKVRRHQACTSTEGVACTRLNPLSYHISIISCSRDWIMLPDKYLLL